LLIDGESDVRALKPGEHAFLPAHCRHRVEWTDSDMPTVWLAIHMAPVTD
jgi:cupin 2 domain-containing protein